MSENTPAIL